MNRGDTFLGGPYGLHEMMCEQKLEIVTLRVVREKKISTIEEELSTQLSKPTEKPVTWTNVEMNF
jgi:hypothetical protein